MNILVIAVSVLILVAGVVTNVKTKNVRENMHVNEEVLGENNESETPTETQNPTATPTVTNSPTATSTVTPTNVPTQTTKSSDISNFIYPGSNSQNQSGDVLTLKSSENPKSVTDWYKDKIKSLGMNVTSFVTTSTNDNINNKLVGAKVGMKVEIEITKKANESQTTIKVRVTQ